MKIIKKYLFIFSIISLLYICYCICLLPSYEHNGITYTDNIESANIIKKGQDLTIRYNPDDPKENYVKGYESYDKVILIIVGTIWDAFLLLIVYCILISIKDKKCKKNITEPIE